jgi:hypothetical protein
VRWIAELVVAGVALGDGRTVVYGSATRSDEPTVVLSAIVDGYAARMGLEPSEAELEPWMDRFKGQAGRAMIRNVLLFTKLNRLWWPKHGGRLVLSAFGTHLATDALLREVEALEAQGHVKFADTQTRQRFVAYYSNYRGDGVLTGARAKAVLDQKVEGLDR